MLKCKVENGECSVAYDGSLMEIMAATGLILSTIYNSIKSNDERAGLMFKRAVKALATAASPVWKPRGGSESVSVTVNVDDVDELLRQMREDGDGHP